MPRYLVEREFPDGLRLSTDRDGAQVCLSVVSCNAKHGVTWLHSYVSEDLRHTFCVYDAPGADAIREAAHRCNLPITRIVSVRVLDPYFYVGLATEEETEK